MQRARDLIKARRYDEARAILVTVDHPVAHQWLDRLDQIAPADSGAPAPSSPFDAAPNRAAPVARQRPPAEPASRSGTDRLLYTALFVLIAILVVVIGGALLLRGGIGGSSDPVLAVIQAHVNASNREDLPGYMDTIHPQSELYAETRAMGDALFELYDLHFQVSGLEVLSRTETEARVSFVLTTTRVSGPDFQDNEVTGVMTLWLDGDQWKIYAQEISNVRYL